MKLIRGGVKFQNHVNTKLQASWKYIFSNLFRNEFAIV